MLQGIATVDTVNLAGKDDTLCTIYDKFVFNILIHAYFVNMNTPGRRQSKTPILSTNIDENRWKQCFDCHLSPDWRQMTIENTVSIDF